MTQSDDEHRRYQWIVDRTINRIGGYIDDALECGHIYRDFSSNAHVQRRPCRECPPLWESPPAAELGAEGKGSGDFQEEWEAGFRLMRLRALGVPRATVLSILSILAGPPESVLAFEDGMIAACRADLMMREGSMADAEAHGPV